MRNLILTVLFSHLWLSPTDLFKDLSTNTEEYSLCLLHFPLSGYTIPSVGDLFLKTVFFKKYLLFQDFYHTWFFDESPSYYPLLPSPPTEPPLLKSPLTFVPLTG